MARGTIHGDDFSMDLHIAFAQALPPRDWLLAARGGTLVGFVATDALSRWTSEAFAMLDAEERPRVQRKRRAVDRDLATLAYAFQTRKSVGAGKSVYIQVILGGCRY